MTLESVGRHPCLLVRRDELGMLGASGIGIEAVAPLERAPGDHAGCMPAVVLRGTDEDVGEPPVLGVDSPPGAHSTTTRIVFSERSTAPRTQPPCSTTSLM